MSERLEPDHVCEPEREDVAYLCFDCRWRWFPDGYWDYDGEAGEIFVPYESECPNCGEWDTDEDFGGKA